MLWRCYWPCLCATAATSIFNASSGFGQLCHGVSTGRFIFQSWAPTVLYIICLLSVLVSAFYFQVPCWLPYSPMGAKPLGFALLQSLGVFPWQAHVQPGDGHQPTPGMHRVAAPSTTLSRGSLMLCSQLFPSHPYGGAYSFGGLAGSHSIPLLPYMVGRDLLFQVWFHVMTQLTLNLKWTLNLVNLVQLLGIRLTSLLTPGLQSGLLFITTFILGSLVRCHH